MRAEFELSGRHVLLMMLAFFASVIAVNAVFIAYAVRSFPGEQEKKSYRQGLQFNALLEERAAQAALGWRASIDDAAIAGDGFRIVVSLRSKDQSPLDGLNLAGALVRPASSDGEQALAFAPLGGGRYEAMVAVPRGAWDIAVTATSASGERFQFTNRVMVR
ncbi:MAG: FixH family protein [Parvularculaceae bacterium]